ncbi:pentapeptide repeat-containing protein [Methylobacterium sp. J-088]|uniref:pentapeptide repeat-containing protein n=1 Tax=Methylobacterium sp. J-088 TaxID=2836664 RepID=UPI001FB95023|nr:pentapeptide repeat-containing protein [Methylobacterium sp. J-088]MCJ2065362.1 pentapeptide repeat-containing protein [Methylobacterium sp. J-088]
MNHSIQSRAHPAVNFRGAIIRHTDVSNADLRQADLSGVDASGAAFRNLDFQDALLSKTILRGADLTGARSLTAAQLATAIIDEHTRLPNYIDRQTLTGKTGDTVGAGA